MDSGFDIPVTLTVYKVFIPLHSASSDLNGMAVLEACNIIKGRLEPFKKANPSGT